MPWTALAVRSIVTPSSGVRSPSQIRRASIVIIKVAAEVAFGPEQVAHHEAKAEGQQGRDEKSRSSQPGGQRPAGRPPGRSGRISRLRHKAAPAPQAGPPCGHPGRVGMAQDNDRGIGGCEEKVVAPGRRRSSGEKSRGALFGQQHELQRLATPVESPAGHRCDHEGRESGVGHAGAEHDGRGVAATLPGWSRMPAIHSREPPNSRNGKSGKPAFDCLCGDMAI